MELQNWQKQILEIMDKQEMQEKYFIINWSINDINAALFLCDLLKEQNSKFVISFTSDEKVMDVKRVSKDEFLNYNYG